LHSRGIGYQLLDKLLRYSRKRGIQHVSGQTMANNQSLRSLAESFGFVTSSIDNGNMIKLELSLDTRPVGR
jgi:acetyltransferase